MKQTARVIFGPDLVSIFLCPLVSMFVFKIIFKGALKHFEKDDRLTHWVETEAHF